MFRQAPQACASDCLGHLQVSRLKTLLPSKEKMTDTEFDYVHKLAEDYLKYVLQDPGIKPPSPGSPALAGGFFIIKPSGKPIFSKTNTILLKNKGSIMSNEREIRRVE